MSSPAVPAPTLRTLLTLAWPVVLARATQSVVGFNDAWMVAPLGEQELAATTTGALDTFALIILPMGTAFIVQSYAAQLAGKGRAADSRRYAWYGLAIAAVAMLVALLAWPLLPMIIGELDAEPRVRSLMTEYVQIRLLSVGAAVGMEVYGNWYAGLGNTRMQLIGGVVVMVSDIFLNWVMIYGHLGFPAMGVAGAAWASTIGTWIGFGLMAWCYRRGIGGVPRQVGPLGLKWAELRRMIRFGLPNGINWFLEFAAFMLFVNVVVVDLGTSSLAALNVVIQINSVSFMPAFGMASAGAILAGQAIGAGLHDQVPGIVKLTMRVTAAWQVGIGLLYLIAPAALIGMFAPDDMPAVELIAVGTVMLQISVAWQVFDACAITLSEVLRAAGDTAWPMFARLGLAWVLFVPAGVVSVMVLDGGEVAVMLCLVIYIAALAGILAWRFRRGAWRKIDIHQLEPALVD